LQDHGTFSDIYYAAILSLGLTLASMPFFIKWVAGRGWGQEIRPEGPADHQVKAGTPTMGGSVFVLVAFLVTWLVASPSMELAILWLVILGGFAIGLVDDLTSLMKKQNLGLKARQKLALQGLLGLFPAAYLVWGKGISSIALPCGYELKGWLWVFAVGIMVVVATTNSVNLADGMDGLASGAAIPTFAFFALVGWWQGQMGVALSALAFIGGLIGFLWFNSYPAKIFMGDTGSLALGGALAGMALLTGRPVMLIVVGGLFVAESTSVIMQVTYFKLTKGKRIFKMSPLHHHFALSGMHEVQVVVRFWLTSLFLALAGLYLWSQGCQW
jgi:phospho-N-acetylmuramoyl-pentapeptide-transferase